MPYFINFRNFRASPPSGPYKYTSNVNIKLKFGTKTHLLVIDQYNNVFVDVSTLGTDELGVFLLHPPPL